MAELRGWNRKYLKFWNSSRRFFDQPRNILRFTSIPSSSFPLSSSKIIRFSLHFLHGSIVVILVSAEILWVIILHFLPSNMIKHLSTFEQIYGYRMSLWAEHTGTLEECFARPETLECVRRIRALGQMNWRQFAAEEITEMKGHLLKYPVDVDRRGKVKPLPGFETFPDVGGNICGSFLAIQENLTIWTKLCKRKWRIMGEKCNYLFFSRVKGPHRM